MEIVYEEKKETENLSLKDLKVGKIYKGCSSGRLYLVGEPDIICLKDFTTVTNSLGGYFTEVEATLTIHGMKSA